MREWIASPKGAVALTTAALITELWRGFLDAMFVLPNDFGDAGTMNLAAVIFTVLFAVWAWSLFAAWRGSRPGLAVAFVINALVVLAVPVGWLFFYCPAACRAEAGVFNLANTLNLLLGVLAAVALGFQLWQRPDLELAGEG